MDQEHVSISQNEVEVGLMIDQQVFMKVFVCS